MRPSQQRQGWGVYRWALVGLLLLAWGLRLPPLLETPLHPDEALYGYWGLLIGRGRDPWLTGDPVYKPPLFPYLVALFQLVLGDTAIALRFPGVMAGLLAVPLVGALTRALYGDLWTALCATMAAALSPFAITFSGSAFTDPVMVALGLGACAAAARGRVRWAGLLAGLSLVTKQTGLVWLPLVLGVILTQDLGSLRWIRAVVIFYLLPLMLALAWDGVRVALGADSFWSAGIVGYGGLRLIWSHELGPRLCAWSRVMASLFASPLVNALLLVGLLGLVWGGLTRRPGTRRAFFDLLLASFCMVYALLHWLVAFPIWSRYLLPLAPILAVLLGRVAREIASLGSPATPVGAPAAPVQGRALGLWPRLLTAMLFLALLLAVPAYEASAGCSPLAEERAAYQGIDDVVSFFGQLNEGAVVYHRWLGWHYHYALFDDPVYLAYWPNPAWLAQDVQAFGRRDPRYIAFPAWESAARVEHALDDVGYALDPVLPVARSGGGCSFVVYHIVPLSS